MNQVQELEAAILSRAERLADELRERANRGRDGILREAAERLRLREAREEASARTQAERNFRQRVQASELKMQSQLDLLRWNLVQDVEQRLTERMRTFMQDEPVYIHWLLAIIAQAAGQIERDTLEVATNTRDHQRLFARWDSVLESLPKGQTATLAESPIETLGGCLLVSTDGRIRVDQTFEGRLERLRARIQQVILEHLLPGGLDTASLFGG
ncbi:V-type ATP synthase subunit E family protein [uncultured Thiodictyon sp.]|uniref:V-type ATP synthase subunit E n=1 Tax=uncultured Thiodictyon sp. TaxID=1846217 RepID=UPI0025F3EB70|nr:V-type ATP synthase subunit E family protein [uncultured Thiodictyon sp.]